MDKGIALDYLDSESVEIETRIRQPSQSLNKILLIERQIKRLERNREFCKICNGELKTRFHARTHYISAKHKKNLERLRERLTCLPIEPLLENINKAGFCILDYLVAIEAVDFFCNVCNITLAGKLAQENHQDAEIHKRNLKMYCDICDLRTISKEALIEHNFFSHQQELQPVIDDDYVLEIPTIYVTPKMSPKKSPNIATKNQTGLQQNKTWNCDVCHETFEREKLFSNHKMVFTHTVLEQLKIQYPPEIVDAVCSIKRDGLFCSLCDIKLLSVASTASHLNCSKHVTRFEKLLKTLNTKGNVNLVAFCMPDSAVASSVAIEEVDSYCNVCNITLVGKLVMESHQHAEIHKRNLERYCDICQVRTVSKEALAEHNFFSHKQELLPSNLNEDVPAIPAVQVSPIRTSKASPKVERNTQIDLKQTVTWNCDVCHIVFEEETTFISHKEIFPHVVLEELKMQYRPEIVDAVCFVTNGRIFCALCRAKVQSIVDTKSHLNCSRHVARFGNLLKNFFMKEDINNTGLDNSEAEIKTETENAYSESEINIPNTKTEEEAENKNLGNNFFYCYLCKMEFDSKATINVHAMSFPHVEVAKLKSELISLGVSYAEYWILSKYYFCCTLCDAKINCEKVSEQHCSGPKHKQRLYRWCKEFSTWKCGPVVDPKHFFCKTCGVPLVGTTEAELHYTMKSHLERLAFYCEPCTVTNSTEDVVIDLNKSIEHQENLSRDIPTTSKPPNDSWNEDHQENCSNKEPNAPKEKKSIPPSSSDVSLEQQIYNELEKIMDTLYYSKSLPLDISLKYAKKINKDICKLQRMYQKRAQTPSYVLESNNVSESLDPQESNEEVTKIDTGGYVPYYDTSVKLDITNTSDCSYDITSFKPEQPIETLPVETEEKSNKTAVKSSSKKKKKCIVENVQEGWAAWDYEPVKKTIIKDDVDSKIFEKGIGENNWDDQTIGNNIEVDVANTSNCLYDKINVSKTLPVETNGESNERAVKSNCKKDKKCIVENVQERWFDWDYKPVNKPIIKDDVNLKITEKGFDENYRDEFTKPVDFKDMLEMINSRKIEYDTSWGDDNRLKVELLSEFETLIKFIDSGDVPPDIILRHLYNCNRELQVVVDSPGLRGERL